MPASCLAKSIGFKVMKAVFFFFFALATPFFLRACIDDFSLPELYQDVLIRGRVVRQGVRSCSDRYLAIKPVLDTLPKDFKSLDIGASQGYFSFRMAEEYRARCTMVEEAYSISQAKWRTGDLLNYLCRKNDHLENVVLLQKKFYAEDFQLLSQHESFDVVLAFSVIHHMKKSPEEDNTVYADVIDKLLKLAPVVIIENPVNTGFHTRFIRNILQEKGGKILYTTSRGTLVYETYLFHNRNSFSESSLEPNISSLTYHRFNGTYNNCVNRDEDKL